MAHSGLMIYEAATSSPVEIHEDERQLPAKRSRDKQNSTHIRLSLAVEIPQWLFVGERVVEEMKT